MQKIWDWQQPHNYHDVQRFLGLIQYLVHFLPDITTYTSPLLTCVRNGRPFVWTPLLNKCFESIKTLTCKAPILKPIDASNPEPIWVICDGSKSGVGVRVRAHLRPAIPTFVRPDHPHRPVRPAGPTGPYRPLSHSLSWTLVCFYYPSLLGTLNSP